MKSIIRTSATRAGVAGLVGAIAMVSGTAAAWAAHNLAGLAQVVQPPGTPNAGQNLNSGGSQTKFTLKLPAEAACSGDTAAGNFHIFSYIADATAFPDPGIITYNPSGPNQTGTGLVRPLYTQTGQAYANANTAPQSGFVSNLPTFDFRLFSIDGRDVDGEPSITLPAGTYNIGIACANADNTTDKYWNTQLTFTANANDPNGLVWEVVPAPIVPDSPLSVLLPLSAAALGGAAFVVVRRRRSASTLAAV